MYTSTSADAYCCLQQLGTLGRDWFGIGAHHSGTPERIATQGALTPKDGVRCNLSGCGFVKGYPGTWIGSTPNFGGDTIASCNLSCAASVAHLQAGASQSAASLALQNSHRYDGCRLGARAVARHFRLRQANRAQFKGGSTLRCLLDKTNNTQTHTLSYCAAVRRGLVHSIGRRWGTGRGWLGPVRLRRGAPPPPGGGGRWPRRPATKV
jgi:hypothetical protein